MEVKENDELKKIIRDAIITKNSEHDVSKILLCEKLYKACTGEASINISFSDLEKKLQGNVKISFRHIEGYGHLGKASFLSRTFCEYA